MKLSVAGASFICHCEYEERHLPKQAGFYFDSASRLWVAPSLSVAIRLREYADETARKKIARSLIQVSPWPGRLSWPDGLTPESWQTKAALYALSRNRSYLALDPGLGKTIVAALIASALKTPIVYIGPPFLRLNVQAEFAKWAPGSDVLYVPDSLLSRDHVLAQLKVEKRPLLIVDEAHRFKTLSAQRTRALFKKIAPLFNKAVLMSGTPMPNRPFELYPVLSSMAPETIGFRDRFAYGVRYCGGHLDHLGHWDFNGASHMDELTKAISPLFMLRIRDTVMEGLPPVTEEMVLIGDNLPPVLAKIDAAILRAHSPSDLMTHLSPSGNIATYRHELGVEKVRHSIPVIKAGLDDGDALIVVGHHKAVIRELRRRLVKHAPLVIDGSTPVKERQGIATLFNETAVNRLLIINAQAGGVGLNLTKANRVIFVEFGWVPDENKQAWKRAHRYGQKRPVIVQYLLFKNSIDRRIMETCLRKKRLNKHI